MTRLDNQMLCMLGSFGYNVRKDLLYTFVYDDPYQSIICLLRTPSHAVNDLDDIVIVDPV